MNFNLKYQQNLVLGIILAVALGVRLWGGNFGLPYVGFQPDEYAVADWGLALVRDDFTLSQLRIGTLHGYIQAGIGWLYFSLSEIDPTQILTFGEMRLAQGVGRTIGIPYPIPDYFLWGRVAVAVMGAVTVWLTYLIGREIISIKTGLLASLFLAVAPLHAEYSHYLIRTIPGLMFLLLAFYIILLAYRREQWWLYGAAVLLATVAVLTKQNNLIIIVPLGIAFGLSVWHTARYYSLQKALLMIGVFFLVLIVGGLISGYRNPGTFIYSIYNRIWNNSYVYGGSHFGFHGDNTLLWAFNYFWYSSGWRSIFFLALLGIIPTILNLRVQGWLLLSLPAAYVFIISFFSVRFLHWLMPIIPFFAILAAYSITWGLQWMKTRYPGVSPVIWTNLVTVGVVLIIFAPLKMIGINDYWFSQQDVRIITSEWLRQNIPAGTKVVIERYGPYLSSEMNEVDYVRFVVDKDIETYRSEGVHYLVGNELAYRQVQTEAINPVGDPIAKEYMNRYGTMIQLQLIQEFVGSTIIYPDQRIQIYQIQ